ncbi:MAG TPA: tRNA pseudouridine(13) synthase TruD [Steroidobacteraceae bacterium]|nr:tRNA pseudouridine(13) synthase TruD [Steroidobacteraceae bacterium]
MAAAELTAREAALAPPRVYGVPPAQGVLRVEPEDFQVEEELGFAPAGSGAHLLLKVRKRNANTVWVARELARIAGCAAAETGYAGLKDRRALTMQWFSVPRPRVAVDWLRVARAEFEVLEAHPHTRKLPRGALSGNHFAVRVRASAGDGASLAARLAPRLAEIARAGVPNYFGPQRFGRDGANLARGAAGSLGALRGAQRGFVLSAARSVIFNAVLAARVGDGSWNQLLSGDLANLAGRGSVFPVGQPDAVLVSRCERLEIHPSGPLWGGGEPGTRAGVLELESHVAARFPAQCRLCADAGMRQERRSLRLEVQGLGCNPEAQAVRLTFRLGRGGFATAVLRELFATEEATEDDGPVD